MAQDDWNEEVDAAHIVADVLGAHRVVCRDVSGAPPSTHDFDLHIGKRVVALEVTTATDQAVKEWWAAVEDLEWNEPTLQHSWGLLLKHGIRVKPLRSQIFDLLGVLERLGIDKINGGVPPKSWGTEKCDAINALHDTNEATATIDWALGDAKP